MTYQEALLLAEYTAVRAEVLHGIDLQQRALQFGFGAVAVVITVAFQENQSGDTRWVLCFLLVPALTLLTFLIWHGELARCIRASYYLAEFERLNTVRVEGGWGFTYNKWVRFGPDAQSGLKARSVQVPWAYGATLALLMLLPLVTAIMARGAVASAPIALPQRFFSYYVYSYLFVAGVIAIVTALGLRRFNRPGA